MCRDAYRANATDDDFVKAATRHGEHGRHGTASCDRDLLRVYPRFASREEKERPKDGVEPGRLAVCGESQVTR
jgi:hypothetical protein